MKPRHRRLALVAAGLLLASAGVTLALGAFRSNLVFFVTPAQIAAGQAERGARARAAYEAARREGTAGSFWSELRGDPARVLLALLGILLALALVALPVVLIAR